MIEQNLTLILISIFAFMKKSKEFSEKIKKEIEEKKNEPSEWEKRFGKDEDDIYLDEMVNEENQNNDEKEDKNHNSIKDPVFAAPDEFFKKKASIHKEEFDLEGEDDFFDDLEEEE